jgi:hypothetical protein
MARTLGLKGVPLPRSDFSVFLRDLILLLGVPALVLGGLLLWWHPWEPYPGASAYRARMRREAEAREAGVRSTTWHSLRITVPPDYILTTNSPLLEVLEARPVFGGNDRWPSRMAFLELDSASRQRFRLAEANCELAVDRCWQDTVGHYVIECQRSSGSPDPTLEWTPHLECQVPALMVRMATNAPPGTLLEFADLFRGAVGTVPSAIPASGRDP